MSDPNGASSFTKDANAAVLGLMPFDDTQDFDDVQRGLVAPLRDGGLVRNAAGDVVFDLGWFSFIGDDESPDTVNPSLWRQSRLITQAGLFEVTDRLYQVRNHDLANVTIVEGDDALVVIDTGTTTKCAHAAMELYFGHRPRKPVAAVIYTHTHVDHYGGVLGVVSAEDVAAGKVAIIAPGDDFEEHALGENVICGNVMSRRANHAFGTLLPHSPAGFVTDGGGPGLTSSNGQIGYLSPTDIIRKTGEQRTIGGLTFVFQMAPDTEAPEEFHIWIPELKALTCAENANHSLHNIQTLRLPASLDKSWFNHGYHGTVNHDVKAVYHKELGWYDGNPAHLFPLPPAEAGARYVAAMGGAQNVLAQGRTAIDAGDYRWAAELLSHAVFADPGDQQARDLQAEVFEQLGYQSEGPQWRNIFLTAAKELREGVNTGGTLATATLETILAMPVGILLDYIAVRLNGPRADGTRLAINITFTDQPDPRSVKVQNGVLHHWTRHSQDADLTLILTRAQLTARERMCSR